MGDTRTFCCGHRKTTCVVKFFDTENWVARHPRWVSVIMVLYYLVIIVALVLMYGRGDFSTPPFVYQEF